MVVDEIAHRFNFSPSIPFNQLLIFSCPTNLIEQQQTKGEQMDISYSSSIVRPFVFGFSLFIAGISSIHAATFTVTTLDGDADTGISCPVSPTAASCTLRQAIDAAEDETTNPGADTIVFANGLTGSLLLNVNDTPNDSSRDAGRSAFYVSTEITIDGDNLTSDGSEGLGMIVLDGQNQRRIFTVEASGDLTVNALTLTNGRSQGGLGGAGLGGAVFNFGDFTLTSSTLVGNSAAGGDGGVTSDDTFGEDGGGGFGGIAGRGTRVAGGVTSGGGGGGGGGFGDFGDFGSGGMNSLPLGGNGGGSSGGLGGGGAGGVFAGNGGFGGGGGGGIETRNGGNGGFGGGGGGNGGGFSEFNLGSGGRGGFGGGGGGGLRSGDGGFGGGRGGQIEGGGDGGGGLGAGGAIFQFSGSLTLLNTSFSNNQTSGGGSANGTSGQSLGSALFVLGGASSIIHSTFVNNGTDNNSDSIYVFEGENDMDLDNVNGVDIIDDQSLTISNSLLADSVACAGLAPIDGGGNSANNGCGPIPASLITGLASVLADNGGPTQTFALSETSNAIDIATPGTNEDQRGMPRPSASAADRGAFELQALPLNLSISETQINEQGGTAVITVARIVASAFSTNVTITSSDPSSASLTIANIEIQANQTFAQTTITSINNDLIDGLRTITFTASATGFGDGTATLDIIDDDLDGDGDGIANQIDNCPADANPDQANLDLDAEGDVCDASNDAALTLVFDNNIITEGGSVSAFVRRNSNTAQALTVDLSIEQSNTMQIPQTVTIAAGETDSESFNIISIDDVISSGDRVLVLMAMATNHISTTNLILIQDDDDDDNDTVPNLFDNCPLIANTEQTNFDGDSQGDACDNDDDNDGLPDAYETANGLNPFDASDANADPDGDNFSNLEEFLAGSDPQVFDNDDNNNGIPDSVENNASIIVPVLQLLLLNE